MQDAQNTQDSVQDLGAEHNRGTLAGAISRRDALAWLSVAPATLLVKDALAQPRRPEGMVRAEGDVRVNGTPAKRGQVIKPGDVVATGRNAFAIFTVGEDAFLMRSVSRVETAGSGGFADVLRLVTGKMLSVFSKGERRLESPTATIGIRGTGVYLEVERTRTYACTCYGSVVLAPAGMPQMTENIKTEHHEQPRYVYADKSMPVEQLLQKAPVINHTDAELILLESLRGRKPPFVGVAGYSY